MSNTIERINDILKYFNIPIEIKDYFECVGSLWIALFECIFEIRLPKKDTPSDSIKAMFQVLEEIGSISLDFIQIDLLLEKDEHEIDVIVNIFWQLFLAIQKQNEGIQSEMTSIEKEHVDFMDSVDIPDLSSSSGSRPSLSGNPQDRMKDIEAESIPSALASPTNPSSSVQPSQTNTSSQPPRIRVSKNSQVKKWLTDVNNDTEGIVPTQPKALKKKKHLRFQEKSPLPLHTRQHSKEKNRISKEYKDALKMHKMVHDLDLWRRKGGTREIKSEEDVSSIPSQSPEPLSSLDVEAIQSIQTEKEQIPLPERNLTRYMSHIEQTIPTEIPKDIQERAWRSQIQLTKKALDHRLWSQKVNTQRLKQLHQQPVHHTVDRDSKKAQARKKELLEFQKAKKSIHDRYRRIKVMEQRQKNAEQVVRRQLRKEELKKDQLSRDILEDYMKEQRQIVIEERKREREVLRQREQDFMRLKEEQDRMARTQIGMLQEELKKLEEHEALLGREEQKELRMLIRESKDFQKKQLASVRSRLENDWEEEYRQERSKRITPRFKVVKK